jgi:hypothetical protein
MGALEIFLVKGREAPLDTFGNSCVRRALWPAHHDKGFLRGPCTSSLAPGPRQAIIFVGLAIPSVDVLPGPKTR